MVKMRCFYEQCGKSVLLVAADSSRAARDVVVAAA